MIKLTIKVLEMKCLDLSDAPVWSHIPYVKSNYRPVSTYKECIQSLFQWHNETSNVWTMILINFASLLTCVYIILVLKPPVYWPFILLYTSSLVHLPFTVGYHLFIPVSQDVCIFWYKLDFSFIFVGTTF